MKFLILLLFIYSTYSHADFILSPGAALTSPFRSEEKDYLNTSLLNAKTGGGFVSNMEWNLFKSFSLGFGLGYFTRSGTTQYKNEIYTADRLDTKMTQLQVEGGAKLRLINSKWFKFYIGGGINLGSLILVYDRMDYFFKNGTTNGLNDRETKSYNGAYFDTGIEWTLSAHSGIRLSAKHSLIKTGEFETLDSKSLNAKILSYGIQYMHYVNWDFFWK